MQKTRSVFCIRFFAALGAFHETAHAHSTRTAHMGRTHCG